MKFAAQHTYIHTYIYYIFNIYIHIFKNVSPSDIDTLDLAEAIQIPGEMEKRAIWTDKK